MGGFRCVDERDFPLQLEVKSCDGQEGIWLELRRPDRFVPPFRAPVVIAGLFDRIACATPAFSTLALGEDINLTKKGIPKGVGKGEGS